MVAILRKNTQRDADGKTSLFRVRGQFVTIEQVEHYFTRKKGVLAQTSDASTPSDVSCWTPSPSPCPINNSTPPFLENEHSEAVQGVTRPVLALGTHDDSSRLIRATPLTYLQFNEHILDENDIFNILSENPIVSYPPSLPQTYGIPERLLQASKITTRCRFRQELGCCVKMVTAGPFPSLDIMIMKVQKSTSSLIATLLLLK